MARRSRHPSTRIIPCRAVAVLRYENSADKLAESYFRSFGTPVTTLRPFNTFGPRQSARAFIRLLYRKHSSAMRSGLGRSRPNGYDIRERYGCRLHGGRDHARIEGMTINLGTGATYSIGWFAKRILHLMNVDKLLFRRASDCARRIAR